jgi:hypothetical protein
MQDDAPRAQASVEPDASYGVLRGHDQPVALQ